KSPQDRRAAGDNDQENREGGIRNGRQGADQPEDRSPHPGEVDGGLQEEDQRQEKGVENPPDEEEPGGGCRAARPRECKDDEDCQARTGERGQGTRQPSRRETL